MNKFLQRLKEEKEMSGIPAGTRPSPIELQFYLAEYPQVRSRWCRTLVSPHGVVHWSRAVWR